MFEYDRVVVPNLALYRFHKFFACLYLFTLVVLEGIFAKAHSGMLPMALALVFPGTAFAAHGLAALGVRKGRAWGKLLSALIGVVLLLCIPVGTVFGWFILSQLGKRWETAAPAPEADHTNAIGNA
jgi:hypothetical protein